MNAVLIRGRVVDIAPPATLAIASGRRHTGDTILKAWLQGKSANTIRSYHVDLDTFALFLARALGLSPHTTAAQALDRLFAESAPSAHEIILAFRASLEHGGASAATINRHLAALRSVSKLARMLGLMSWYLEVPGVKAERRRDTTGPTLADVWRMLETTSGHTEGETRDYAIVVTFVCLGLRVSELCGLNLEDCDFAHATTWIHGKGRRERELVPLPAVVVDALRRYLPHRGGIGRGPLFLTRSARISKSGDHRLEPRSVCRIVRTLGQRVGLHVWPHGLRHTAITTAIQHGQKAGVGLDQIRHFSRHRSLATMLLYRDEHDKRATQRTLSDVVADTLLKAR